MAARIYITTDKRTGEERLIKSNNAAQSRRYVSEDTIGVRPASALEVAERMSAGLVIEDATSSAKQSAANDESGDYDEV